MRNLARLAAASLALALLGIAGADDLSRKLDATSQTYLANLLGIAAITSRDSVMDYDQRLIDDKDYLTESAPTGYAPADWDATVHDIIGLDLSVATQLTTRRFQSMSAIRGLGEAFVRSSVGGKWQPVAVYVPASYVPGHPVPLVVFLHGHDQPESELLGQAYVQRLADRIGSIVVAPYGRGRYDFGGTESDVYDAYDAAIAAFSIDPRKRFLAGYSMGGFSVFNIAPMHPNDWSAVMCIAGGLLGSHANLLVAMMSQTPFYVLTGALDTSVPTQYPTATAIYLREKQIPVTLYSQPDGTHHLITLLPILTRAWDDMAEGIVRTPAIVGDFPLPVSQPNKPLSP